PFAHSQYPHLFGFVWLFCWLLAPPLRILLFPDLVAAWVTVTSVTVTSVPVAPFLFSKPRVARWRWGSRGPFGAEVLFSISWRGRYGRDRLDVPGKNRSLTVAALSGPASAWCHHAEAVASAIDSWQSDMS